MLSTNERALQPPLPEPVGEWESGLTAGLDAHPLHVVGEVLRYHDHQRVLRLKLIDDLVPGGRATRRSVRQAEEG